jgi:multidrug efflux pump
MNISAPFIRRPVATTLLTAGVVLVGAVAFKVLPVSPLPQVDFPTISVSASLPGASPDIIASSIATPLERQFSHIAGVTEMTSSSSLGSTSITLQFDLRRRGSDQRRANLSAREPAGQPDLSQSESRGLADYHSRTYFRQV